MAIFFRLSTKATIFVRKQNVRLFIYKFLHICTYFGLHTIIRFSCSTSLRLNVKSLPANLKMDGSDSTGTVGGKLYRRITR